MQTPVDGVQHCEVPQPREERTEPDGQEMRCWKPSDMLGWRWVAVMGEVGSCGLKTGEREEVWWWCCVEMR